MENGSHSSVAKPKDLLSDISDTNIENPIESQSQYNEISKNTCTTKVKIPNPYMIDFYNGVVTLFYEYWYTQMKKKIEENAHFMPIESDRMIYI